MSHIESVINNMVEISVDGDDGFRKAKETLTRMGVPAKNEKKLFQSVHILHKQGKYYLCHFKELFNLDGRESTISEGDIARRNRIVQMMIDWNLVTLVGEFELSPMGKSSMVKVIKHSEKNEWTTLQKYAIGVKRNQVNQKSEVV
jgi:hypothetical protein